MADADHVELGPFRFNIGSRSLLRAGMPIVLPRKASEVLAVLAAAGGNLVTKDDLVAQVWGGAPVSDNTIQVHMSALRKALAEVETGRRYIVASQGRGYRLQFPLPDSGTFTAKALVSVSPFQNISGDPTQDYFASGLTADIAAALMRFSSISVVTHKPTDGASTRTVDPSLLDRYSVAGQVQKAGSRLRIHAKLTRTSTGAHLWAAHFDGNIGEAFGFQDEITARVVGALVPNLEEAEIQRARRQPPQALGVYDLFLKALANHIAMTESASSEALGLLEEALHRDPNFSPAAMLASTVWNLRLSQGWTPTKEARNQAIRFARRALQLHPNDGDTIATLARWLAQAPAGYEEARPLVRAALQANSHSARVWRHCGFVFLYMGEHDDALRHLQRCLEYNPQDLWAADSLTGVAIALLQLNRQDEALEAANSAVQLNPKFTSAIRAQAACLAQSGQFGLAREAIGNLLQLDPSCSVAHLQERYGYSEKTSGRYLEGLRRAGLS